MLEEDWVELEEELDKEGAEDVCSVDSAKVTIPVSCSAASHPSYYLHMATGWF